MRKSYLISLLACITILISGCTSSSSDQARIAQLEAQIAELQGNSGQEAINEDSKEISADNSSAYSTSENSSYHSQKRGPKHFVGTYEFTDKYNTTWVLILKQDESLTINIKGSDEYYYGSWSDSPYEYPLLNFGWKESPMIAFPSEETDIDYAIVFNDKIYSSNSAYKAKNPNLCLPIKKIK